MDFDSFIASGGSKATISSIPKQKYPNMKCFTNADTKDYSVLFPLPSQTLQLVY